MSGARQPDTETLCMQIIRKTDILRDVPHAVREAQSHIIMTRDSLGSITRTGTHVELGTWSRCPSGNTTKTRIGTVVFVEDFFLTDENVLTNHGFFPV
jgi:hypothetical protein